MCTQAPRSSPFAPPSTHLIVSKRDDSGDIVFDLHCSSGSGLVDAEAFILLVGFSLSDHEAVGSSPSPLATQSTTLSEPVPVPIVPAPSTVNDSDAARARQPTSRVRAGRELRKELLKVAQLRNRHKIKDAEELFSSLDNSPREEAAVRKEKMLAQKRALDLRNCCFSMGGLSLTRRALEHFLNLHEVRLMMPNAFKQQRQEAVDAATSKLLLDTAKAFLTQIFKARSLGKMRPGAKGGRKSDEDRNAFAAALAALLPASLFENKQGRAAMRILGISYRQAKFGSRVRGELEEDWGRGWKRIKTAQHQDKV